MSVLFLLLIKNHKNLFTGGARFPEQVLTDMDFIWFMGGSSFYVEHVQYTGFAAIHVGRAPFMTIPLFFTVIRNG